MTAVGSGAEVSAVTVCFYPLLVLLTGTVVTVVLSQGFPRLVGFVVADPLACRAVPHHVLPLVAVPARFIGDHRVRSAAGRSFAIGTGSIVGRDTVLGSAPIAGAGSIVLIRRGLVGRPDRRLRLDTPCR
jgi:hypothetical protein